MRRKNVSKTRISAQAMVVIIEEVHTKHFESLAELKRNVERVLFPQKDDVKMSQFYLESVSFLVEIIIELAKQFQCKKNKLGELTFDGGNKVRIGEGPDQVGRMAL